MSSRNFDGIVVLASNPTIDGACAVGVTRTILNTATGLDFNPAVRFEDEDGMDEITRNGWGLDLRAYSDDEGSRIRVLAEWLGIDLRLPRYRVARQLADDLTCNNGVGDDKTRPGGFLKDESKFPFSLVRSIRDAWNVVLRMEGDSGEYRRYVLDKFAVPAEAAMLTDTGRWTREELDREVRSLLGHLFTDRHAPWMDPEMPWLRGAEGLREKNQGELPADWWFSRHPLTLCGAARQLLRCLGREARNTVVLNWAFDMLELMTTVEQSAPNREESQCRIRKEFRFGAREDFPGHIARVVHVDDSRQAKHCWTIKRGEGKEATYDKAQLLIIRDTRFQRVTILTAPGTELERLERELCGREPGRWEMVTKLRDDAGRIKPAMFNGGYSRAFTGTRMSDDNLVWLVTNLVRVEEPDRPVRERRRALKPPGRKPRGQVRVEVRETPAPTERSRVETIERKLKVVVHGVQEDVARRSRKERYRPPWRRGESLGTLGDLMKAKLEADLAEAKAEEEERRRR